MESVAKSFLFIHTTGAGTRPSIIIIIPMTLVRTHSFIQKMMALPFLPEEEIEPIFQRLQ